MKHVSELSLPELAIEDPAFGVDPVPLFAAARNQHPWLAKTGLGYIVTEFDAINDLLRMDDRMRGPYDLIVDVMNAKGSRWERFQKGMLAALSGDSHRRIRNVVASAFTPRAANQQRGLMREVIARLLAEWGPKGRFDFEEFASYFPISVMCNLIGAPASVVPRLRPSLEALGLSGSLIPGTLPELEKAVVAMEDFLVQLVADRRRGDRIHEEPDLLDALIIARDSDGLNDVELNSLLILMFVAGYDTSKNVLTMIMSELIGEPDMYSRCAEDLAYCHRVVEENLRFQSPANSSRLTNEALIYRDVLFPKDTMLFLPNSMSGRDPSAFPEPDKIDPERPAPGRHIAFGRGMHMCLGQHIARAQISEGLHQIAQRITKPKLVGPVGHRPFPGVWGLKGLPIEFTLAPPRATLTTAHSFDDALP